MHNYAAAIFAQGLAETAYLVQHMGGGLETVFSLPGAGDLYVTTQGGRNSRMGRLLGLGMSYSEAVEEMPDETIEGVDAVVAMMPAIEAMTARGEIAENGMPLADPPLLKMIGRRQINRAIEDPELRRKVTPSDEFGCKRVMLTDDWYPALAQPNVELVTELCVTAFLDPAVDIVDPPATPWHLEEVRMPRHEGIDRNSSERAAQQTDPLDVLRGCGSIEDAAFRIKSIDLENCLADIAEAMEVHAPPFRRAIVNTEWLERGLMLGP